MPVARILLAVLIGGYGALAGADPLATALRPTLGIDAPICAVIAAPILIAALVGLAAYLTRPIPASRTR